MTTFTQNLPMIPGADSAKLSQSKNAACTRSQPGALTMITARTVKTTVVETAATSSAPPRVRMRGRRERTGAAGGGSGPSWLSGPLKAAAATR